MKKKIHKKYDAILLLGLRLKEDGTAEAEMIGRARKAAEVFKAGISDRIIACGGKTREGCPTEAAVLKEELIRFGVPENAVVLEDESLITVQNIANARAFLKGGACEVALVTSDYHGFRARAICRKYGIKAVRFDAPTANDSVKRDNRKLECMYLIDFLMGYQTGDKQRPKFYEWIRKKIAAPVRDRVDRKR